MNSSKAKEIIAKHVKLDPNNLDYKLDFKKDLHIDSIDLFQIVMEIEEEYNVKIENEELLNIKTIGDAISKIENAK